MDESETRAAFEQRVIGFFDQAVLSSYRDQPDKFTVETNFFEGQLSVTSSADDSEYINVQFGYRARRNGDLAVAVFLPGLFARDRHSLAHLRRWAGYRLDDEEWTEESDERYTLWRQRNLDGDWGVDNGPLYYLQEEVRTINALTRETLGCPLFLYEENPALNYPSAQNTHRYQDAHRELYNYLLDGLDRETIERIAAKNGRTVNARSKQTRIGLKNALASRLDESTLWGALDLISEQRRAAGHGVRPSAQRSQAFEDFDRDLRATLVGIREMLAALEEMLGMSGDSARRRQGAKGALPTIDPDHEIMEHFSITQLPQAVGKTIERIEVGFRQSIAGVHEGEVAILHFTDGSILGIDTGSNAYNLASGREDLQASDFSVDLRLQWVPALDSSEADSINGNDTDVPQQE